MVEHRLVVLFAAANKVYIFYCSSDAWIGDVPASSATYGWAFRGQRIVSATFTSLAATHGLGSGAEVLFGGCSAGARGTIVLLDYIAAMLPSGASVKGMMDAGLWIDLTAPDTSEVSLPVQAQAAYSLLGVQSVVPAECASQYAGSEWKCIYPEYRLPFVTTPYIINAAQFDSFAMVYDLNGVPETAGQVAFANKFQATSIAALQPAVQKGQGVFSTSCLVHCLTQLTASFTGFTANGYSFSQSLAAWKEGASAQEISSCRGYLCADNQAVCPGGIPDQGQAAQAAQQVDGTEVEGGESGEEVDGRWMTTAQAANAQQAGDQQQQQQQNGQQNYVPAAWLQSAKSNSMLLTSPMQADPQDSATGDSTASSPAPSPVASALAEAGSAVDSPPTLSWPF